MGTQGTPVLEELFHSARTLPAGPQREAYVSEACREAPELRTKLEALLRADADDTFLAEPPNSGEGDELGERPGDLVGPYKLLEQIGEGGFGVVWMAEQREPVRRRVALKIIKLGMDTREVIARFEAERQALALMDHPHIARVLDAGATETGRPYFVMDLVNGLSILQHCDEKRLDTRTRLDLFVKVCLAIQHAHQKGVIHRDIKPSNVLVTLHDGVPVPKVIDFGIAKATDQELTEKTLFTRFGQLVGSPLYMSPEQAERSGLDVDTRADVYSLGVLLYELLTGTTPFEQEKLEQRGYEGVLRAIREEEPHTPSTRISSLGGTAATTASRRRTDVRALRSMLRGDLDWIVMRCLEKDRTLRYDTASALAEDVRRHLDDEPVNARPPSVDDRLRKFYRRYRKTVTAAVVVLFVLILGVIGTTWGMLWAIDEKGRAETAEEEARGESYRAALAAASLSFQNVEFEKGRSFLEKVPEEKRGWVWKLLRAQVDEPLFAFEGLQAWGGANRGLAFGPQGEATHDVRLRTLTDRGVEEWSSNGDRRLLNSVFVENEPRTLTAHGELMVLTRVRPEVDPEQAMHRVIDVETGQELARYVFDRHAAAVGLEHAATVEEEALVLRKLRTGAEVARRPAAEGLVPLTFGPRDETLLVRDEDHRTFVLDQELVAVPEYRPTGYPVDWAIYAPHGRWFATVQRQAKNLLTLPTELVVWDAVSGARAFEHSLYVPGQCWSVAWSPEGTRIAAMSDQRVFVVDPRTSQIERTLPARGRGADVAYSPDGKVLAVLGQYGGQAWDARDPRVLADHQSFVYPTAFSPDGRLLASGGHDGKAGSSGSLRIWDARTGAPVASWGDLDTRAVTDLAFTPDGSQLLVGPNPVRVFDVRTGVQVETIEGVRPFGVSPDGKTIAVSVGDGYRDHSLTLVDRETGRIRSGRKGVRRCSGFSPDGSRIAASFWGGGFAVFDTETLQPELEIQMGLTSIVFSSDGERLLTAHADGSVRIWDARTGEEQVVLRGPETEVLCAVFAHDEGFGERLVLSGSRDGHVRIWDVARREVLAELTGHGDYVYSLALSPDGQTLASGSGDTTVRLWRTEPLASTRAALDERAELVTELEPTVSRLLRELEDPGAVVERLESELQGRRLDVALQTLLSRTLGHERVESSLEAHGSGSTDERSR